MKPFELKNERLNVVIVKKTVKKKGKRRSKEPSDGRGRCPLLNPINIIERSI